MPTSNYFRSKHGTFFFDHHSAESATDAWARAAKNDADVHVWKAFPLAGPWRHCDVVGLMQCAGLRRSIRLSPYRDPLQAQLLDERFLFVKAAWARAGA